MKKHAGEMMTEGIRSIELIIEGVGKPGKRVPVARSVGGGQGPEEGVPGEAVLNMLILRDVNPIVEVDERVVPDGTIDSARGKNQQHARNGESIGDHPII